MQPPASENPTPPFGDGSAPPQPAQLPKPSFAVLDTPAPQVVVSTASKKEQKTLTGREKVQNEVHDLAIWGLRFGALLILALFGVRIWHLIAPVDWRWLWGSELESIDKMLFSSAFGGLVLGYLRSVMDSKDPPP